MPSTITSVSTEDFARQVEDPAHNILDTRAMAAYNGWRLNGAPRGGHVPGASSIPLDWTQFMDWVEVPEEKELTPESPITVYGHGADDAEEMADYLIRLGFEDVRVYDRFHADWAGDPHRPLRRLERYRQLVPPSWLRALLDGEAPEDNVWLFANDVVVVQ